MTLFAAERFYLQWNEFIWCLHRRQD